MTKETKVTTAWNLRLNFIGCVNMLRGRAMAGLAGQSMMMTLLLLSKNVIMTVKTGFVSGVHRFLRSDFVHRGCPVMPVFPECIGDQ